MKKGMKRLVSCLLAIAMVLTMFGVNTKTASAEERTMQNYVYDGYEVDFDVTDAWDGAFNAEVKLANTSDAEIRDWALSFEFAHEIQNLWNATVVGHTGSTYVIKNADWNANIKPGEAVTFGMTVLCDGEIVFPENFSFVMEEEPVTAQSYSAEFTLYSDWGTGCNGAIILSNLTDEPIENWQLEFDYDREIVDIANAVIVSHEQNHYVIKIAENNANIAANSSVHISIVAGEGAADERPEKFTMQQTVVGDASNGEEGGSGEKPDDPDSSEAILLYVLGKYNAENHSIDMEWFTNASESDVTVWTSKDNVTYEKAATVTGEAAYQYAINEEFETKYFKASVVDEQGDAVETIPFVVVKTENGYAVNALDSDNDGIADEYEVLLGTDVNLPDTDGDGLSDYDEVYVIKTEPTVYDSVEKDVSDAKADSDKDKLSNEEELTYGTDASEADTDRDGLSDYDEIFVHKTKPSVADTDEDTVNDGDEIAIGFDPLNPTTFGVPDAEYTVEQTISVDSEALEEINTDENDYRLSVDVTASGYVEGNLTAKETGYAAAIQNEFMVGIASELSYTNADGIESVTLTFELDDEVIEDSLGLFPGVEELSGIRRFNVFKYFEELNMLLPIETVVDEENNRIYATTDGLGIYCVMDMELWLASFDVPEEVYQDVPVMFSMRPEATESETTDEKIVIDCIGAPQDMEAVDSEAVGEESTEEEVLADTSMMFALKRDVDKTPIDVVFLLQSSGQLENTFINQKNMIYELLADLGTEYGRENVRFAVITYNLSGAEFLTSATGDIWFSSANALSQALYNLEYEYAFGYTDRGTALQKLQNEVEFKENASKFIFQVMNGSTDVGDAYFDQISTCEKLGINYSELIPEGYFYLDPTYGQQVADAIASTNGLNATYGSGTQLQVYKHITTYAAPPQMEFDAIVPTGWKHIVLDGILDPDNGVNSDTDELTDWEEVNTEVLSWDTDGTVILPTIKECTEYVNKSYATAGLTRFVESKTSASEGTTAFHETMKELIYNTHVLPIHSDPTMVDTDGDNLLDDEEFYLGTYPLDIDSDKDRLSDWLEVELWFDPLASNPDGDSYSDYDEWNNNSSPFVYNMTAEESEEAFIKGGLLGDFETADNLETLSGQIVFSFIPFVADGRDFIANAFVNRDGWAAVFNVFGFVLDFTGAGGVAGDGAKAVTKLGRFVTKYADDAPKVVEAVVQTTKYFPENIEVLPELVKVLPAGTFDNLLHSVRNGASITRADYDKLCSVFKAAGKNVDEVVASTKFGSFSALKKYLGHPGEGKQWHHIVEQCQAKTTRSGFDIGDINSVSNVKATPNDVHKEISKYYSQKHDFTDGKTFRDWLNGKTFDEQTQYGIQIWEQEMKKAGYPY